MKFEIKGLNVKAATFRQMRKESVGSYIHHSSDEA